MHDRSDQTQSADSAAEPARLEARAQALAEQVRSLTEDRHTSTELLEHAHRELEKRRRDYLALDRSNRAAIEELKQTVAAQQAELDARRTDAQRLADRAATLESDLAAVRKEAEDACRREIGLARLLDETLAAARAERGRSEALSNACGVREQQVRQLEDVLASETEVLSAMRSGLAATAATESVRLAAAERSGSPVTVADRAVAAHAAAQRHRAQLGVLEDLQTARTSLAESLRVLQAELDADAQNGSAGAPWYMRDDNGVVYGPVTFEELTAWVADCRVAPEHAVSRDGQTWERADACPGLRRHWPVAL